MVPLDSFDFSYHFVLPFICCISNWTSFPYNLNATSSNIHQTSRKKKESARRLTFSVPSITPAPQEQQDANGLEPSLTSNTSPSLGDGPVDTTPGPLDSISFFFDVIGEEEQQNENNNNPCKIPNIDAKTQNPKIKAVTQTVFNDGEAFMHVGANSKQTPAAHLLICSQSPSSLFLLVNNN